MYYEINVSLNGKHLFATAERSITNKWQAKKIYDLFSQKFPADEGYKMTVTYYEKIGHIIDAEEEL